MKEYVDIVYYFRNGAMKWHFWPRYQQWIAELMRTPASTLVLHINYYKDYKIFNILFFFE